jgi:DNA-binding MarR family transcriptional regulator
VRAKRTQVIAGILAVNLFIIEASLGFLLNLVSADLGNWYSEHLVLVLVITGVLIIVGVILSFARERFSPAQENDVARKKGKSSTADIDALSAIYEAYRASPGDKVHSEAVRQELGLSEQAAIDLIKKLEERGFVRATWVGRWALLHITEDGVALVRDS